MLVKQMHMMRIRAEEAKRSLKNKPLRNALAKEIELRKEEIIRDILHNSRQIIQQQLSIASLPITPDGPDNDTVLKATNSLLDRSFGKPKESAEINLHGEFSLIALAQERKLLTENKSDDDE